jgi:hypothetical protein
MKPKKSASAILTIVSRKEARPYKIAKYKENFLVGDIGIPCKMFS